MLLPLALTKSMGSTRAVAGSCVSTEKPFHFRLHGLIHLDQRWPGAFESFAGEFFCRVNAEFAADGDFARRMIQNVRWTLGEDAVALGIRIGAQTEQHFA